VTVVGIALLLSTFYNAYLTFTQYLSLTLSSDFFASVNEILVAAIKAMFLAVTAWVCSILLVRGVDFLKVDQGVGVVTFRVEKGVGIASILSYFLVIVSLTVLHILLKDHIYRLSILVGLGIVQALYVYVITKGGELTIPYSGLILTLNFEPIVYLMMTNPLVNMAKQICEYVGRFQLSLLKWLK